LKKNRQFFTMKFNSSRLKEFDYNISLDFNRAKKLGEIIALSDSQMLRSVRKIQDRYVDLEHIDQLYILRDKLKRDKVKNKKQIIELQNEINRLTFVPEYISIVMDHPKHYEYLFYNGLILNGKKYVRFSCSAGQARVSTVIFCDEGIVDELNKRLNNGRDMTKPLTPSKFNAYFGVSGSATKKVSTPEFCLVPDYETPLKMRVNYVTETDFEEDDIIDIRELEELFNRFDGQGLVSIRQAKKWAEELGLDYIPAQWCIRQNFIKGMLCTFDIHGFCNEINNGNYNIKTSYKDENGSPKIVDIRDIDVILSESQFKLWDSFDSIEQYKENCEENHLYWGISLYTPKKDKDILRLNYQFLQTLNLNKQDIETVCKKFVDWIEGVSSENIYYTLLFLLGENIDEEKLENYFEHSDNHWIKALMLDHGLLKDKYIRTKIYDLIKTRIQRACLGEIIVDGNFQVIVSDPYAQMQHVCGLEVKGLLKANQYYSSYWNNKNVSLVDSMRAPLTYRSEHVKLNLIKNDATERWYKYCYSGILVNVFGKETVNWAGSDFDYDILATASNETIIKGVYEYELPVVYAPPQSVKKVIEPKDLYEADLFSFGSQIGAITNKSTSAFALLPRFKENSEEHKVLMNRLKMCTKLQSAQIDKAKIGREVKGIPSIWVNYNKINDDDTVEIKKKKELLNNTLLDKHPYFFIYLYKDTKRKYKQHLEKHNLACVRNFGIGIDELKSKKRKTVKEIEFLNTYHEFMPVIDSDSVMNSLCKYIESIDFDIQNKIKLETDPDIYKLYMSDTVEWNTREYELVKKTYGSISKDVADAARTGNWLEITKNSETQVIENSISIKYEIIGVTLDRLGIDNVRMVNYLLYLLYVEKPSWNKDFLWNVYGNVIVENLSTSNRTVRIPLNHFGSDYDVTYLNDNYKVKEVELNLGDTSV